MILIAKYWMDMEYEMNNIRLTLCELYVMDNSLFLGFWRLFIFRIKLNLTILAVYKTRIVCVTYVEMISSVS